MSPQTVPESRRRAKRPAAVSKVEPSTVILYGTSPRVRQVHKTLQGLDVTLTTTPSHPTPDAQTLGIVVVTPLETKTAAQATVSAVRARRDGRTLPVFVVVDDDATDRAVRRIYAAGATAVFHWPRETLLFPRLVAELLGVVMVRGRARGPRSALSRTLTAHLRLIPWSTSDVRASAQSDGVVQLSGTISTLWRKRELERLLARIAGVTRIVSKDLLVEPGLHTDRRIAQSVRTLLRNTTAVDDATVSVAVHGGTVTLAGTVANRRELARILELVSNVAGVRDLTNALVVSSRAKQTDAAAARRLNGAISRWFPEDRVHAAVFAQVAVLSGKVRGLSRRHELELFVEQDPAVKRVISKLDVV